MDSLLAWARDNTAATVTIAISILGLALAWKQLTSSRTQVRESMKQTRIAEHGVLPRSTEADALRSYVEMLSTRSPSIIVELDKYMGMFTHRGHPGTELLELEAIQGPDEYLDLVVRGTIHNASGINASIRAPDVGFRFVSDHNHALPKLLGYLYLLPAEASARFEWTLSLTMNKALAYYATWYYKQFEGESANVMAFMSSHIERIWTGWNHGREETWGSHGWQLRVFPAPAGPDMIIFERVIEVSVNRKLVGGHKRGPTNYVWRFRSVPLLVSQEFREVPKSTADLRRILGMHDLD